MLNYYRSLWGQREASDFRYYEVVDSFDGNQVSASMSFVTVHATIVTWSEIMAFHLLSLNSEGVAQHLQPMPDFTQ